MRFEVKVPMIYTQFVEVEANSEEEATQKILNWDGVTELGDPDYDCTILRFSIEKIKSK